MGRVPYSRTLGLTIAVVAQAIVFLCGTPAFITQARGATPPNTPLDCEVYKTKRSGITVGISFGNLLISATPTIGFSKESGIAWDRIVQGMVARFVELCTRYNAGLVTEEEYEHRLQEIENLHREAKELERQMIEKTRAHAKERFNELDRIFPERLLKGERPGKGDVKRVDPLENSLGQLAARIEELEPVGSTLKPTKPCPPPDMLGAPGYSNC